MCHGFLYLIFKTERLCFMKKTIPSDEEMDRIKERMLMRIYEWDVATARKYLEERRLEEAQHRARNEEQAKKLWYRLAGVAPEPF